MLRLRRFGQWQRAFFSQETPKYDDADLTKRPDKFWVIPVAVPLFPGYVYTAKWSKLLRDLFRKHDLRYVLALPLKDGVNHVKINPANIEELQKLAGLDSVPKVPHNDLLGRQELDTMTYDNKDNLDTSDIFVLGQSSDALPIGSICRVSFTPRVNTYLKPDIRVSVDLSDYEQIDNIYFLKSSSVKAFSMTREQDFLELASEMGNVIKKIQILQPKNWSLTFDPIKWEMWCGFLFNTTTLFSRADIFRVYGALSEKICLALMIQYLNKYADSMKKKFDESKEAVSKVDIIKESYERLGRYIQSGESDIIKYAEQVRNELKARQRPTEVVRIIESELNSIVQIGKQAGEQGKKKAYISYLLQYPFGVLSKDTTNIDNAATILDEDHYGMKKVKERILEFIAIGKLKGNFKSKVLLLHGPPGVGKSSIAKSIARSLGRTYERISLGGEVDPDLLRGHRRTYVASYPGKIFAAISRCKTSNPVILLDEIDKIDIKRHGSSLQDVILEILDPMQNVKFKDTFLDVDIDLSNVLFVCTANVLDTISPPLLDRLERIQVTGYTLHEKKQIFRRYLFKKAMNESGLDTLTECQLKFSDEAMENLIENYCREAGVRRLGQQTQKLCQKVARKYVEGKEFSNNIEKASIREYLGEPKFIRRNILTDIPTSGMAIGLAYTGLGGCTLPIESSKSNLTAEVGLDGNFKKGSLLITGNLQDVMKQSCQIAYTYAKFILAAHFNNNFLEINDVHINFPELEIGKDGPSAGIAITTTFISLALDKPMVRKIGMTGEINLSGDVMKIGGVKEKILGARRDGVTCLIFPFQNRKDIEELQPEVKQGVELIFVRQYEEVIKQVFGIDVNTPTFTHSSNSSLNSAAARPN